MENSFQKFTDESQMILNTVGTICIFKLWALDSEKYEREVYPKFSKKDLENLKFNEWVIKRYSKPELVFLEQKLYEWNNEIVPILKEYSSKKYWRRIEFIERETRARFGLPIGISPQEAIQDKDKYKIPKEMQENDSDLVELILWSLSSTIKEKQELFDMYTMMNEEQRKNLRDAFAWEKVEIKTIEKDKLNKKRKGKRLKTWKKIRVFYHYTLFMYKHF